MQIGPDKQFYQMLYFFGAIGAVTFLLGGGYLLLQIAFRLITGEWL